MDLRFPAVPGGYTSASQIARIRTEAWAQSNLYCAACPNDRLAATPPNTPAVDFLCESCGERYQLKSGRRLPSRHIVDAGYAAMIQAIRSDRTPSLAYLHYDPDLGVKDVLIIPRVFLTQHCIEPRAPLGPTARRAGWIGCNIRIDLIPAGGRIEVVALGVVAPRSVVRSQFAWAAPLAGIPPILRGWPLAVLLELQHLGKREFNLTEIYAAERSLSVLFPLNRHVRPKIRQQLQVLRDAGLVEFIGRGRYRLRSAIPVRLDEP